MTSMVESDCPASEDSPGTWNGSDGNLMGRADDEVSEDVVGDFVGRL